MTHKGREREKRGFLKEISELPKEVEEIVFKTKEILNKYSQGDYYLFGSYFWGIWDEQSDIDIMSIEKINNIEEIKKELKIMFPDKKIDIIQAAPTEFALKL